MEMISLHNLYRIPGQYSKEHPLKQVTSVSTERPNLPPPLPMMNPLLLLLMPLAALLRLLLLSEPEAAAVHIRRCRRTLKRQLEMVLFEQVLQD